MGWFPTGDLKDEGAIAAMLNFDDRAFVLIQVLDNKTELHSIHDREFYVL